ncbi:MAG: glycosyltransferase family 39 protein [Bacteroidales bacterium]|nr:glycosyltransferase family 39 protein [Bacteroidales bacterium]
MEKIKSWIREYRIILLFALAKLMAHILTATNYGFQRDAYLYMAQAKHLDWGYFSTPPLVAFVTRLHTTLRGDSLLAVRLLPALTGIASLFMAGWLIKQLRGGVLAQVIGLTAILLSPAFLRTASLLQPVVFNHLFWLLSALVISNGIYALPLSLPIYKPDRLVEYGKKQAELGLDVMFMWEDGKIHELPQDFADMVGWDRRSGPFMKAWTIP